MKHGNDELEEKLNGLGKMLMPGKSISEVVLQNIEKPAGRRSVHHAARRWWGRPVAIPWPIAAVFLIAFGLVLGLYTHDKVSPVETSDVTQQGVEQNEPYYYERALYVKGMGFIDHQTGYQYPEENNHGNDM